MRKIRAVFTTRFSVAVTDEETGCAVGLSIRAHWTNAFAIWMVFVGLSDRPNGAVRPKFHLVGLDGICSLYAVSTIRQSENGTFRNGKDIFWTISPEFGQIVAQLFAS